MDDTLQEAISAHKQGNITQAIELYEKALQVPHAKKDSLLLHLKLATLYQRLGHDQAVLKHYHQALTLEPGAIEIHYQLGRYFLYRAMIREAGMQFKNVLSMDHTYGQTHFYLGVCCLHEKKWDEAEYYLEKALQDDPNDLEAWVNLGVASLSQNKEQLAVNHFTHALTLDAGHEAARSNLAATFMHFYRYENALTHYLILLESFPENLEYQYATAFCEMTLGQLAQAESRFRKILCSYPQHFSALYNLALIALRQRRKTQAAALLAEALKVNPKDASAQHLLASLTHQASSAQAAKTHAKQLFDQYALYYENHMLQGLAYQLPWTLFTFLKTHGIHQADKILDLGCGTGLCGEYLSHISSHITGVDISPNMLLRAKEKGYYAVCIEQELQTFLSETTELFDLIVGADVLPYVGELADCFHDIRRCLPPRGHVAFSVEVSLNVDWYLQETARYAHSPTYIEACCHSAGLKVLAQQTVVSRTQQGQPLEVMLFLVGLPPQPVTLG